MTELEENDILAKWMAGKIDDNELKSHVPPNDYERYKAIIDRIGILEPDAEDVQFDFKSIKETKDAKVIQLNRNRSLLAVAASIAVVVGVFIFYTFGNDELYYATTNGEVKEFLLPDGQSKVHLAANSSITMNPSDWPSKRHLKLEGRAYFVVQKGNDFVVDLNDAAVRVLGTRFEVHDGTGFLTVKCFEGKVEASNSNNTVILSKSESLVASKTDKWSKSNTTESEPSWLQGDNQFKEIPLIQVIDILEREFKITIEYDDVDTTQLFTGYFPRDDQNLALQLVFEPFGITYELTGNKLVLSSGK